MSDNVRWSLSQLSDGPAPSGAPDPLVQWLGFGVSVLAVIVSIVAIYVAYRAGKYRLRITSKPSVGLLNPKKPPEPTGWRPVVMVWVNNDGRAPAQIRAVFLEATDGTLHEPPRHFDIGPTLPHTIAAGGGHAQWTFDQQHLRDVIHDRLRDDDPPRLRAAVKVGSKTYRQRGDFTIASAGQTGSAMPLRDKVKRWLQSWTRTHVFPLAYARPLSSDPRTSTYLLIGKSGRGLLPSSEIVLVACHTNGRSDRVESVPTIPLPRFWRGNTTQVIAPILDDSLTQNGDTLWWHVKTRKGLSQGLGALTVSQLPD